MPLLDGTLDWTYPALAAAGAPLAALGVMLLARRGLHRGASGAAWLAAVARGLATGLAVLAAAGPVLVEHDDVPGNLLAAYPDHIDVPPADHTVTWPAETADAVAALEVLRAARDPARETRIYLATDGRTGTSPEDPALPRAFGPAPGLESAVLRMDRDTEPAPETAARAVHFSVPAGAGVGAPIVLTLDAGRRPFLGGWAEYTVSGRTERVLLPPGATRVDLPPVSLPAGTHLVHAQVAGRLPAVTLVDVAGEPSVLLLTRSSRESLALSEMLEAQGIHLLAAGGVAGLSQALDEASAVLVGPGAGGGAVGSAVANRVRQGTGLLVLGGPDRAGLSRLHGSPLAEILPVEVPEPAPPPEAPPKDPEADLPEDPDGQVPELDEGEKKALRVALLICMDRSGSMDGRKLVLARAAAIAAARNLAPTDYVGVIAFSDGYQWVAPFQRAVKIDVLARRMREVRAGGWTNFYPPLKAGYQAISEQPCGIRHMILFTDGKHNAGATVFGPLVLAGTKQGVTLSTVAVGDDAASNLLAQMAGWGQGGYYWAQDPERLPAILTMDTHEYTAKVREARRKESERRPEGLPGPGEGGGDPGTTDPAPDGTGSDTPDTPERWPRTPRVTAPAPALAGLEQAEWPPLAHPEEVEARPASHTPLVWDSGTPALALGRAGLGRTAVLTADITTAQATEFRRWEHSGRFTAQLVRSLIAPADARRERPSVRFFELPDGRAYVRVDGGASGMLTLDALGGEATLRFSVRAAEGCSLGGLDAVPPRGAYAGVLEERGGRSVRVVAVSPGPGLARRTPTAEDVALRAGVALLETPPEVPDGLPVERREPAETPLLLGAVALLLVEAAFRRGARTATLAAGGGSRGAEGDPQ